MPTIQERMKCATAAYNRSIISIRQYDRLCGMINDGSAKDALVRLDGELTKVDSNWRAAYANQ